MTQHDYNKLRSTKTFSELYDHFGYSVLQLEREYSRDFMETAEVQMDQCDYWDGDLELLDKKIVELAACLHDTSDKWFQLNRPSVFRKEHEPLGMAMRT